MKLNGKTAVVSGAAKGIGKALVMRLRELGCDVIEVSRSFTEPSEDRYEADITDTDRLKEIRDDVLRRYGHIDILVNNAARQDVLDFDHTDPQSFQKVVVNNLCGTYNMCHTFIGAMGPGSTVINMLSVHSEVPRRNKLAYDASKAGLGMLTKELALELADRKITVNGISFGAVATPMNSDWLDDPEKVAAVKKNIPLDWIASPEEIADFTCTVIEKFSDVCTGATYVFDGGRSLL